MKTRPFYVSCVFMMMTGLGIFSVSQRPEVVVAETRLEHLPLLIDSWRGVERSFDQSVYKELNADANLLRDYFSPEKGGLSLYVGYYGTQKGGRTGHLPQHCYTGQGWSIDSWEEILVSVPSWKTHVPVNKMVVKKENQRQIVLFWFQSGETHIMATGLQLNLHKLRNRLFYNRNDGAFVRLSIPVVQEDVEAAFHALRTFAGEVIPLLSHYWPVEREV